MLGSYLRSELKGKPLGAIVWGLQGRAFFRCVLISGKDFSQELTVSLCRRERV